MNEITRKIKDLKTEHWMKIKDVDFTSCLSWMALCCRSRLECLQSDVNQFYNDPFSTQSLSVTETDWIDVTTEECLGDMKISLRHFTGQKYFMYFQRRCLWFRLRLTLAKQDIAFNLFWCRFLVDVVLDLRFVGFLVELPQLIQSVLRNHGLAGHGARFFFGFGFLVFLQLTEPVLEPSSRTLFGLEK